MTVRHIEAAAWDVPMRAPYRSAQRVTTTAHNVLVTITLDSGATGYGESAPAFYVTGETQESVLLAVREIARALAECDTTEAASLISARMPNAPGARGALETALADAGARAAGLPLYRFLGAAVDTLPERSTDLSLPILPPAEAGERAAQAARDGFRALKIKVGGGGGSGSGEEEDAARVRAIANAAPHASLRLDGNQGFAPEKAVRFLEGLTDLLPRIEMLEQPTKAGDDAALAFVSARVGVPVFADESVHGPEDARRLLKSGACQGVVLKLAKSGLTETAAIARAAHAAGGRCLFGCMMETQIAIGAALHLTLALGADIVPMLDLDGHLLVRDDGLLSGGLTRRGDTLIADAHAAGLGVTLL